MFSSDASKVVVENVIVINIANEMKITNESIAKLIFNEIA